MSSGDGIFRREVYRGGRQVHQRARADIPEGGVCIPEGVGIPGGGCTRGGEASIPDGMCMYTPRHGT